MGLRLLLIRDAGCAHLPHGAVLLDDVLQGELARLVYLLLDGLTCGLDVTVAQGVNQVSVSFLHLVAGADEDEEAGQTVVESAQLPGELLVAGGLGNLDVEAAVLHNVPLSRDLVVACVTQVYLFELR